MFQLRVTLIGDGRRPFVTYPHWVSSRRPADIAHLMVVPDSPGPLLPLAQVDGSPSDVDDILDDMFGKVDDDGPSATDAALVTGGTAAVIASQVMVLPAIVLVGGIASIGLGAVLPIRSGLRRLRSSRRDARIRSLIGDDHVLDTSSTPVRELVAAHDQMFTAAATLPEVQGLRVRNVAHGLVVEVAMLLDGHTITSDIESLYVGERLIALRELLSAVAEAAKTRTNQQRSATVEARVQLDADQAGTALDYAASLTDDLRTDPQV